MDYGGEPDLEKGCNSSLIRADPVSPPAPGTPYTNLINRLNGMNLRTESFVPGPRFNGNLSIPFSRYAQSAYSDLFKLHGYFRAPEGEDCITKMKYPASLFAFVSFSHQTWRALTQPSVGTVSERMGRSMFQVGQYTMVGAVVGGLTCAFANVETVNSKYMRDGNYMLAGFLGGSIVGLRTIPWGIGRSFNWGLAIGTFWWIWKRSWIEQFKPFARTDRPGDTNWRVNHIPRWDGRL